MVDGSSDFEVRASCDFDLVQFVLGRQFVNVSESAAQVVLIALWRKFWLECFFVVAITGIRVIVELDREPIFGTTEQVI